jgi:tetratricopeptide (TPR) repeat protein
VKKALVLLAMFVAVTQVTLADESRFAKADKEFSAGDFKAAIADYEAMVTAHEWSANLFYNLGNAYFHVHDFGRAILNYERALQIDPHHPEAEANLRLVRDQTRGLEFTPTGVEKILMRGGTSTFAMAAASLLWLAVLLLVLRARGGSLASATMCLLISGGCAWAAWKLENGINGKGAAIVVAGDAEARVATADTARSMLVLPAGSEVIILQRRGDWDYAVLPNNQRGWISTKAIETVRL